MLDDQNNHRDTFTGGPHRMPLQDYHCKNCAKIYEIIVPLAENDKKIKCPECKKVLKKLLSPPKTIKIN